MQKGVCPKCSSQMIIKDKPIADKGQYGLPVGFLSVAVQGKRTSWLSRDIAYGEIRAWICGEYGYTELYTTHFKELLDADRESGKQEE